MSEFCIVLTPICLANGEIAVLAWTGEGRLLFLKEILA